MTRTDYKEENWIHTKDNVKYVLLEHPDWQSYPEFDTIEEAYKHKAVLEDEHPSVYMLEPIDVVVY
jgi:hypothetical protein